MPTPAPVGHVAAPDPPGGMLVLRAWEVWMDAGGPGRMREVPDHYGGSEASAVGSELPLLRDTWRLRTRP